MHPESVSKRGGLENVEWIRKNGSSSAGAQSLSRKISTTGKETTLVCEEEMRGLWGGFSEAQTGVKTQLK